MARETGIYRRRDSRFWWIDVVLPSGKRICLSARTEDRAEAEALLARLKADSFREAAFGIKPRRMWQEAVVRYLEVKASLRSIRDLRRICRRLDPYLGGTSCSRRSREMSCGSSASVSSSGVTSPQR